MSGEFCKGSVLVHLVSCVISTFINQVFHSSIVCLCFLSLNLFCSFRGVVFLHDTALYAALMETSKFGTQDHLSHLKQ